jgi:hypothetical protein
LLWWSAHGRRIPKPASLMTTRATYDGVVRDQLDRGGDKGRREFTYTHGQIVDVIDDESLAADEPVPTLVPSHVGNY